MRVYYKFGVRVMRVEKKKKKKKRIKKERKERERKRKEKKKKIEPAERKYKREECFYVLLLGAER